MLDQDKDITCIIGNKLSFDTTYTLHSPRELKFSEERFDSYRKLLNEVQASFFRDYQGNFSFIQHRKDTDGTIRGWGVMRRLGPAPDLIGPNIDKFKPNANDATDCCFSRIEGNWYLTVSQTNP